MQYMYIYIYIDAILVLFFHFLPPCLPVVLPPFLLILPPFNHNHISTCPPLLTSAESKTVKSGDKKKKPKKKGRKDASQVIF